MKVYLMLALGAMSMTATAASPNPNGNTCNPTCDSTGGECRKELNGSNRKCCCNTGYTGTDCGDYLCTPSCQNGGTCTGPGTCSCPAGYTGVTCEVSLCASSPCQNGGTCTGANSCDCVSGYSGDACERKNIGCYNDGSPRAMSGGVFVSDSMTLEVCYAACKAAGYQYFGVQSEDECYCGDSYDTYGQPSGEFVCFLKCSGDATQYCGDELQNDVYEI